LFHDANYVDCKQNYVFKSELFYFSSPNTCSAYIKKIIDDAYASDDTLQLLQFLSWENLTFSQVALSEILGRLGFSYTTELKTFLDILASLLKVEDSWQLTRITNALKGNIRY